MSSVHSCRTHRDADRATVPINTLHAHPHYHLLNWHPSTLDCNSPLASGVNDGGQCLSTKRGTVTNTIKLNVMYKTTREETPERKKAQAASRYILERRDTRRNTNHWPKAGRGTLSHPTGTVGKWICCALHRYLLSAELPGPVTQPTASAMQSLLEWADYSCVSWSGPTTAVFKCHNNAPESVHSDCIHSAQKQRHKAWNRFGSTRWTSSKRGTKRTAAL